MPELSYNLFHQRTAENIIVELKRLRKSLLGGGHAKAEIQSDVSSLETLLSDNILDFKASNPNHKQLKTREVWHEFLTESEQLSFNECLLILLGISPKLSEMIEPSLFFRHSTEMSGRLLFEELLSLHERLSNRL